MKVNKILLFLTILFFQMPPVFSQQVPGIIIGGQKTTTVILYACHLTAGMPLQEVQGVLPEGAAIFIFWCWIREDKLLTGKPTVGNITTISEVLYPLNRVTVLLAMPGITVPEVSIFLCSKPIKRENRNKDIFTVQ